MIKSIFRKKTLRLFFIAAITLTTQSIVSAQGGLFHRGSQNENDNNHGSFLYRENNSITSDISNQTFETPIGSGLVILLSAGAGYALLKNKKEED